jgi:hypothetical protein
MALSRTTSNFHSKIRTCDEEPSVPKLQLQDYLQYAYNSKYKASPTLTLTALTRDELSIPQKSLWDVVHKIKSSVGKPYSHEVHKISIS